MPRLLVITGVLTLLAACGSAPQAMPARPPKPDAPPAAPVGLLIAPGAIGPATTTTPFTLPALTRSFPVSDVRAETASEEGFDTPVIIVSGPEDFRIEFHGGDDGTVDRAFVTGAAARGLRNEVVGMRLSASGLQRADCIEGAERLGDAIICRRPDAPQLGFVFAPAGAADPVLREFYWTVGS